MTRATEAESYRGVPSHGTQELKAEALLRAHSIGYPREISRDNAMSELAREHYQGHTPEAFDELFGEGRPGRFALVPDLRDDFWAAHL